MNTAGLLAYLHPSPQTSGEPAAAPTLASCGGNPDRYIKAMERHFRGDMAKLHAHMEQQSTDLQKVFIKAFIDDSEALRDFLDIMDPDGFRKKYLSSGASSPRIPDLEAPVALALAATHSTKDTRVLRSLARLDKILEAYPPDHRADQDYQQRVETAFDQLLQGFHQLPAEAAQQKAVELIEKHYLLLKPEAQAEIVSLARNTMGSRRIGDELKIRLQKLSESRGTARVGDQLKMDGAIQPRRAANRGKASFSAILKNSVVAPPQSETTNPASRPYTPIKLKTYSGYGAQTKVRVQCTDYAKQAAELLIDRNGELDGSHVSRMLDQLKTNKTLPAEHRQHLIRTLVKLKQGGELANTINSICQDKPLKGGAADVVRGTLDLPLEHAPTKEDARKAVVMSLLGYLRQSDGVGSCFATAPAICLLDSSPETVARDMKELLEDHKLTFQQHGILFEAPLNLHIYQGAELPLRADGTYNSSNGFRAERRKLIDSPGMQAALNALGIPENERQAAITGALSQMGYTSRQRMSSAGNCKQIIEYLARTTPSTADPDKRIASTLRTFNGKQDVGLLQAWEYTLATSAQMPLGQMNWNQISTDIHQVSIAIFHGRGEIPGRPELQSPVQKSSAIQEQLCSDQRFKQTEPRQINQHLFNEISALFEKRFVQQFDMNVSRPGAPALDGVSEYGGFTLYEKIPADNPSQWKRIHNADAFQDAMVHLVKDASETARTHVDSMPGDLEAKREALHLIADHVMASIQDKTFIEHAVLQMNQRAATQPLGNINQYKLTPWEMDKGSYPDTIIKRYGGKLAHYGKVFPATSQNIADAPSSGATQSKADDMRPLVNFFCEGLTKMARKLQAKAQESPDGFKIPVMCGAHAFSLMPMEMKELWSDNPVTPEKWIDDNLKKPAMQWLKSAKVLTDKIPAKIIADRNWTFDDGHPQYLGILYNPFTNKVEAKIMRRDGTGRRPIKEGKKDKNWLVVNDYFYEMFTPLANKTKPRMKPGMPALSRDVAPRD